MRSGSPPPPFAFLLVPVLYYLAATVAVSLTTMPDGVVTLWPATAVLLAALLWFGGAGAPLFVASTLAADLAARYPGGFGAESVLVAVINSGEACLAYWLLMRQRFDRRFLDLKDSVTFLFVGPGIAAALAALLAAVASAYFRGGDALFPESFRIRWFGDALGLAIVTSFLLTLAERMRAAPAIPVRFILRDAAVIAMMAVIVALLLWGRGELVWGIPLGPFLLVPFVLYFSARAGPLAAGVGTFLFAGVVLYLVERQSGLFGQASPRTAVIVAQEFIFIVSQMALGLAALLGQIRLRRSRRPPVFSSTGL